MMLNLLTYRYITER